MPISMTARSCSGRRVEQCQGDADLVVLVAARLQRGVAAGEDGGGQLLGRGLADAAGDADDADVRAGTPGAGQRLQGAQGVIDQNDHGLGGRGQGPGARGQGRTLFPWNLKPGPWNLYRLAGIHDGPVAAGGALNQRGDGPAGEGVGDEGVAVGALADKSDEDRPRPRLAAVDHERRHGRFVAGRFVVGQRLENVAQGKH
jgi:hypothetical protein